MTVCEFASPSVSLKVRPCIGLTPPATFSRPSAGGVHMCARGYLPASGHWWLPGAREKKERNGKQRNTLDNHLAFAFNASSSPVIYVRQSFVSERFELRQPCGLTDSLSVGQQPSVRGRTIIISPVINGGGTVRHWGSETRTRQ